jgi:hypothetical protein
MFPVPTHDAYLPYGAVVRFAVSWYDLGSGVQTIRPGRAGPVSVQLGGTKLTGCFLRFGLHSSNVIWLFAFVHAIGIGLGFDDVLNEDDQVLDVDDAVSPGHGANVA